MYVSHFSNWEKTPSLWRLYNNKNVCIRYNSCHTKQKLLEMQGELDQNAIIVDNLMQLFQNWIDHTDEK